MAAHMQKLTGTDYRTSAWSGGVTTQLAICPPGARYADRDFLWRLSSATVELERSDFTVLPDYMRLIATLRGEITLRHNGGAPIRLRPFEVHAFDGADETACFGRCTDFNLMLRKGAAEGSIVPLTVAEKPVSLAPDPLCTDRLLYCAEGTCNVTDGGNTISLAAGETLRCDPVASLTILPAPRARLILCRIRRNADPDKTNQLPEG